MAHRWRQRHTIDSLALERLLDSYTPLSEADAAHLRDLLGGAEFEPGLDLAPRAGGAPRLVLSGWAARTVELADGRRQIVSLALPGDLLSGAEAQDLGAHWWRLGEVWTVSAAALLADLEGPAPRSAALAAAWSKAREAATNRELRHCVRLGRLNSLERTASLFLELHDRQRRAGLADGASMSVPLTQEMMGDLLGLSTVHMNRVMQQLRREGLIAYRGGRLDLDLEGLAAATSL